MATVVSGYGLPGWGGPENTTQGPGGASTISRAFDRLADDGRYERAYHKVGKGLNGLP